MTAPHLASPRLAAAISAALALAVPGGGAHAAHFVASSFVDDAGDPASLRGAICAANANDDAFNSIELLAGRYLLTVPGAEEDDCATGDLDIRKSLALIGAGANASIVDAAELGDRVFDLHGNDASIAVVLQGMAVTGGEVDGDGGGLRIAGDFTVALDALEISNNHTVDTLHLNYGAGIQADGNVGSSLQLNSTTVAQNTGVGYGGGLMVNGDTTLLIRNSTIADNSLVSSMLGAGLVRFGTGVTRIINSTISGNSGGAWPGLYVSTDLHLESSVVAGNIREGSTDFAEAVTGPGASASNNVIGRAEGAPFLDGVDGNHVGANDAPLDAGLKPLADNGGPVRTVALQQWSPARDNGSNPDALSFDQRGEGWPRSVNATDSGAFELGALLFADGFEEPAP